MKRATTVGALLSALVLTMQMSSELPALAAPRQIEEFCLEQTGRYVTGDPYRRGAWEAAMANCIADLTPTPTEKRRYRYYRKY
jgi:hypothetical protein